MRSSFTTEANSNNSEDIAKKTVLNSPSSVTKYCYKCRRVVWTKIKYYPTLKTRMMAFGLSPCLLCWVPFFCHWKAELDHHCRVCNGYLGTFNPIYEQKSLGALKNTHKKENNEEKKLPQKKYREVGRRCGENSDSFFDRDEIMREYKNVLQ